MDLNVIVESHDFTAMPLLLHLGACRAKVKKTKKQTCSFSLIIWQNEQKHGAKNLKIYTQNTLRKVYDQSFLKTIATKYLLIIRVHIACFHTSLAKNR